MLNTSINIETSSEDIRGGFGALLLGKYFHSSNMTMELEDSMFRIEWLKYSLGASMSIGSDILISETVTLDNNKMGILKNPPAFIENESLVWIETEQGTFDEVEVINENEIYSFVYSNGIEGNKYCVKYYTYNEDATTLTVSANIIPDEVKAIAKCQIFAGSKDTLTKSSRIGFIYIEIPRLLLSAGTSLSLTHTGAATSPLSGTALSTDSEQGCEDGGYYAKIIKVEEGSKWYDTATDLIVVNNDIELTGDETEILDIRAYSPLYNGYKPPYSDLNFISSNPNIAFIDESGVVSGISNGDATIVTNIKKKTNIGAIASVSISGKEKKFFKLNTGTNISRILNTIKSTPTSIVFESNIPVLNPSITKYDLSLDEDGSIIAYIDTDKVMRWCSNGIILANDDSSNLFQEFDNITTINFNNLFDTSTVFNMNSMFIRCPSLTSLDLSSFNTSSMTNMSHIFSNCPSLTSLDLSSFNTSNATSMYNIFSSCKSLTSLDLSLFNTSKVTDMGSMFYSCPSLISLDLSKFDTSNVADMSDMFRGCSKLTGNLIITATPAKYLRCFKDCSTDDSANLIVDYTDENEGIIDAIIATKSDNSHITKKDKGNIVLKTYNMGDAIEKDVVATLYKKGLLEFSGTGSMSSFGAEDKKPWADEIRLIKSINFQDGVSPINLRYYFSGMVNLTDITNIPQSVTDMDSAFIGCTSLIKGPIIPNGIKSMSYIFKGCTNLVDSSPMPNEIDNLSYTFDGCTSLEKSPSIPNSVVSMDHTFFNCAKLKNTQVIPSSVIEMNYTFGNCISLVNSPAIPDNVIDIQYMFDGCTSLVTPPTIHEGITLLTGAFRGCSKLSTAPTIHSNVINVSNLFKGCSNLNGRVLVKATITDEDFYSGCFENCSTDDTVSLKVDCIVKSSDTVDRIISTKSTESHITKGNQIDGYDEYSHDPLVRQSLRNGTKTITDENLFTFDPSKFTISKYTRTDMNDIIIPKSIKGVEVKALVNVFMNNLLLVNAPVIPNTVTVMTNTFQGCSNLAKSPSIPGNVSDITGLFQDCTSLVSVLNLPDSITKMSKAFGGCTSLITVPSIPNSVTDISNTFYNCSKLTEVLNIPSGINNMIGSFYGCSSLVNIGSIPTGITNLGGTFQGCSSLVDCPEIPENVTSMNHTFEGCSKLNNTTTIPDNIISMNSTFKLCSSLINAPVIPEGVTEISEIFNGCSSLVKIDSIPLSVNNMVSSLSGCSKLTGKVLISTNIGSSTIENFFKDCSTAEGTSLVVDYTNTNIDAIDSIIATKSVESNIVKGININDVKIEDLKTDVEPDVVISKNKLDSGYNISTILSSVKSLPTSITFESEIPMLSDDIDRYDISLAKDKSIIAYVDNRKVMHWCSNGVIQANEDCDNLFGDFENITTINFDNLFITTGVTNMSNMFIYCAKLKTLDLSRLDTSKVVNTSLMFHNCENLITEFTISNILKVFTGMFERASINTPSKITVNCNNVTEEAINEYISMKSENSNVVKGINVDL